MINTANTKYWDNGYKDRQFVFKIEDILFKDLFDKYLPIGGTCLEVGCYPGNYLVYFGKYLNYTVSGIDTTPYVVERLPEYLKNQSVKIGNFYQENFLTFSDHEQYDLVCSFGFIEHFKDFSIVLEKHINFVKPGGYLVISCPNFRGLQYFLHRILDNENLKRHVTQAMDLKAWSAVLQKHDMEIIYQNYFQTAGFWVETSLNNKISRVFLRFILNCAQFLNKLNHPNMLTSPYMISISKKIDN